jgi:hypothetical protein
VGNQFIFNRIGEKCPNRLAGIHRFGHGDRARAMTRALIRNPATSRANTFDDVWLLASVAHTNTLS